MTNDEQKTNFDNLEKQLEVSGGLIAVTMEELRDAYGTKRLGRHVATGISNVLAQRGIGHNPPQLPTYQHESVRLFRRGTAVGKLVDAVLSPTEIGDTLLREATHSDSAEILQKIRELVCED